jgi:cytochrome c oxidase subunit 4
VADPSARAHPGPHVLPPRVLLGTGAALLALTATTVALSLVDFGRVNVVIALGVATVKAALVALFFMHLRYSSRFFAVVIAGAAVFAALLIGFILFDTTRYQPDVRAHEAAAVRATPPTPPHAPRGEGGPAPR